VLFLYSIYIRLLLKTIITNILYISIYNNNVIDEIIYMLLHIIIDHYSYVIYDMREIIYWMQYR
jgi:hypothetical protein